jgi:hypothetical protein
MKEAVEKKLMQLNKSIKKVKKEIEPGIVKKTLIKMYLASPPKVQFALAKYGIKAVLNKKKEELEELIRH